MLLSASKNKKRSFVLFSAGALLGCIAFVCINTAQSLNAASDAWIMAGYIDTDMMQHYAGWLFYRASPLTFPVGAAQAMQGACVTFSDSVPLAAIFFRLLSPLLPPTFQYFGLYTLVCYALQGGSAALLLSLFFNANARGNVCVLLGSALFAVSPVMIDRSFRHTSLASHFFLLFALYLYFLNRREPYRFRLGWLALCALATTVHPYFVPMVLALLFADLIQHAVQTRRWLACGAFLTSNLVAVLLTGWLIGAFSMPGAADTTYGFWSMNLNALYNPWVFTSMPWSRILPLQPLINGNADGFNYLGLGVLLFGALALLLWTMRGGLQRLPALWLRHWGLLLVCSALTIFSITHIVVWNDVTLFSLPLPRRLVQLCSTFRASGRMFWPVNYLLVLCTVVFWGRRGASDLAVPYPVTANFAGLDSAMPALATQSSLHKPLSNTSARGRTLLRAAGCLLLAALLALQLWDLSPGFAAKRRLFQQPGAQFTAKQQSTVWETLAGQYTHFFSFDSPLQHTHTLALWAAKNGMTTNDPFTARYDAAAHSADAQTTAAQLMQGVFDDETLYFTCDLGRFQQIAEGLRAASADVTCALVDKLWYVVIPNKPSVVLPTPNDRFVLYPNFPLLVADYTDALWTNGVLNSDPRTVLLYDSAVTAAVLDGALQLQCEGKYYDVIATDYKDAGWVMVTLDLPDASVLQGKALTSTP